ncbi:MAG: hydantoinase/oxoprolinase family protein [Actinomycetes bacterium]
MTDLDSKVDQDPNPGLLRVGIDVGGTFTDAVLVDELGNLHIAKVESTPADISEGFLGGLGVLHARSGRDLAEIDFLAHGTTVATNALVQNQLARVGLITNRGFRDILEIGTQQRRRIYDLWTPEPTPVVPRERCVEVDGRIGPEGQEITPLDEESVVAAAAVLREQNVEVVAVVLLFSFVEAAHEQRIREILAVELPGIPVTISSDVSPEIREYLRASTTAVNASLLPLVGHYVTSLAEAVASRGVRVPVHLMRSNGGLAASKAAAELPVSLVTSGPAAGVVGAARLGALAGERELLTFDMGGTTADLAVVVDGAPQVRWSGDQNGHRINLPQVDVLCVGAGGGSIARVDSFGALRVGPESAGAVPGPAAYGRGGESATVTDAHVVLGTLTATRTLGGELKLDPDSAVEAVARGVAVPMGTSVEHAAASIIRVADSNMASSLRVISVARGLDPREMTLVALGGAGPMHGCSLAEELDMTKVLVPLYPGVTAALGLLLTEVRHDLGRSWVRATGGLAVDDVQVQVDALARRAHVLLEQSAHAQTGRLTFTADLRYSGQAYSLSVPLNVDANGRLAPQAITDAELAFIEGHRAAYDYVLDDTPMELVAIRVSARAPEEAITFDGGSAVLSEPMGRRRIWMKGAWQEALILDRSAIGEAPVPGPAVIEQEDTTTLLFPGWTARRVAAGSILLEREVH